MKKPPCARFGMRISPKASEKPDESRNSSPPKAMLLSVWMIQNCIEDYARCHLSPQAGRGEECTACADITASVSLQILRRRVVARIDRVLQELVLIVGPELAHVWIGLDHGVDVLAALL